MNAASLSPPSSLSTSEALVVFFFSELQSAMLYNPGPYMLPRHCRSTLRMRLLREMKKKLCAKLPTKCYTNGECLVIYAEARSILLTSTSSKWF